MGACASTPGINKIAADSYRVEGKTSKEPTTKEPEGLLLVGSGTRELEKKYVVHRGRDGKLGSGAYSTVYKCTAITDPDEEFAVKEISLAEMAQDELDALHIEVDILRSIDHPNVIKLYDFFEDAQGLTADPKAYIVTEKLSGGELFDRIVARTYYNEYEARQVIRILLDVMSHLHGKNIAHRDLKPENLLLKSPQSDHELKVADFGFAAYVNKTGSLSTQCGTPNYVAPEILRAEKYGTAVDMWSIGVLTFVLLGGYPPFHDENQAELFRRIKRAQFEFTPDYWDVISSEAKDFISKLLVTDPTQRLAASQAMLHPWILKGEHEFITQHLEDSALVRLKQFNAKRKFKAAARMVIMARRISKTDQRMRSEQPLGVVTSEIVDAMAKSACLLEDAF